MKARRLSIILSVAFAMFAFGAFNTSTAEAGHRHRGGFYGPRVVYRPAYRPVYRRVYRPVYPVYPRYRSYGVGVYVGPSYGYGYGPGYGYGGGYGGGFCY